MKKQSNLFKIALLALFFSIIIVSASAAGTGKIIGIEPGAGVMQKTETAIDEYNLDFNLISSSSAGMATELTKSVSEEKWIVVTGWTPHWKFARFDLKYLEDPKNVFGGEEYVATLARKGFKEDNPGAFAILEHFFWTPDDMTTVMLDIEDGAEPADAAQDFVNNNQDMVTDWIGDVTGDGSTIEIGYVLWDSEIASTNVLAKVMEQAGYNVKLIAVDAGPLYQALSTGDMDCTISSWLPVTHSSYMEKFGDDLVEVGTAMEGCKIGLVVPEYVTISSIDELNSVADKFQ
ncbi:MAG: glycine/betaine ABC transporter [Methanomicrobiales archaeon]|nr:glycine/betaine ABC transporter [Methanomicrobiales archaeon]